MDKSKRSSDVFWSAVLQGMAASFLVSSAPLLTPPRTSDFDAMRNDWRRIGDDFRGAIAKANKDQERKAA